ncbi:MAG: anti-sigma factor domain-containing protein [Sedimentibacter sp.]|uniref:anti-sigma factor domain-containing protein n=1 Tax=Sedimentibacter sp. TaxID=1960295 RepID=UPI0029821F8D|nr:anti-sigma factor domain-containing protein [Sedimentibacter sp.]MDW5299503.1 anti-sigma factor domain-containing protein [Sedimentibacter sp.]
MRAVIVEIKGSNAAVMSDDGRISKIKNKNYTIGQEITIKNNNYIKWVATIAAVVMLFATPAWAYLTPYSYVSLDVNPSVEFSINRFDRVLEVKAVNDDAEEIIEEINVGRLKNKEIQEAVRNVISELKNQGYIVEGEEGGVVIAASSKNEEKTNDLAAALRIAVHEEVKSKKEGPEDFEDDEELEELKESEKQSKESEVDVEVIGVSQEKVNEAKERGVTPGKMNLLEKLKESSESPGDFDVEKWLDKPVKDIMKATKENNKAAKQENKENKEEEINVNGNGNRNNDAITEKNND